LNVPLRRSERVAFTGGAGAQLAGIVDLPTDPPRAMALFAHCFTCSKDIKAAVRIARALASAGYGVLRFDFMGLGDSQGDFAESNFSTNCADLAAAARFAGQTYLKPTLLVGHSFGGAACLAIADQLESVLGVATIASPSDTHHLATLLERMSPNIKQFGRGEVTIGGRTYTITRQMLDDFREFDMAHTLGQFTKPVLIFHAPGDETLRFSHALRLLQSLTRGTTERAESHHDSHSLASLISLPGADHLLTNRAGDVEYVAAMIATWWRRLLETAPR
jgi:putative redox protein